MRRRIIPEFWCLCKKIGPHCNREGLHGYTGMIIVLESNAAIRWDGLHVKHKTNNTACASARAEGTGLDLTV
jgi:hypothetical protein